MTHVADQASQEPRQGAPLVRPLGALVHLVQEISRAHDARDIYEPALSALRRIVGVERSSILLLDPSGVSRFVAWRGISAEYRMAVEGHFPWKLDNPSPQPIVIGNTKQERSLTPLLPVFEKEIIGAIAFIPLVYRDRLVGKFMLYFNETHDFTEDEIELACAVAYLVAFAIERTRLYAALKEAEQRKDTFLATLSHELRNPLAPASAALALIAERPEDRPTLHQAHAVLDRSIHQIVKLVDDLLDVSRITREVITLEKQPVELTSVVHHAVAPVEALIISRRQQLTFSLEPVWVEADALRLEQVITNLVHNAAKYTPAGGHLQIFTSSANGGAEIRIRDDGIGIAPDLLPRVFDLFVQADKSLAKSRGGLGIGLTIVRKLVELHGGTVRAASDGVGRGTEFTVWLPGRIDARRALPQPMTRRARGPRRRILVVDDNEDAATMLATLLEAWGHEVSTVATGPAALAAAAAHPPEVVLLDLGLPGMSGYEVAAHLRALGDKTLRIVAVSGYGQPDDVARARAAGCDAHLAKPVALLALERLLAEERTGTGTSS